MNTNRTATTSNSEEKTNTDTPNVQEAVAYLLETAEVSYNIVLML